MARIGFKIAKYNKHNADNDKFAALGTASKVPEFEKVVEEKFAPEYNSAELYGNDVLAESDNTFKKGTLTLTLVDDNDTKDAELLGNTVSSEKSNSGEVTMAVDDSAPEVGYGHIVTKIVGGARKYKVEFFPRVKFNKVTHDAKTRGESVEFNTVSIEGIVYPLDKTFNGIAAGTWEKHKTFDSLTDAETYLDTLLTPTAWG